LVNFVPGFTFVAGGEELTAAGAEINSSGIASVDRHCIAQDGFIRLLLR
jgi:hypothetical protein